MKPNCICMEYYCHTNDILHVAAFNGHDKCVTYLLNLKADPNYINVTNKPPLWEAIRFVSTTKLLLEAGADPRFTTRWGDTLLDRALGWLSTTRFCPSAALLMQYGARDHHHKYSPDSWIYEYDAELDAKHKNCVRGAVTLCLVCKRYGVHKDVYKQLCKTWVISTWVDDEWLFIIEDNKKQKL